MLPVGYQKPKPKGHVSQKSVILALLTPHPVAEITFFFFSNLLCSGAMPYITHYMWFLES